MDAVGWVGVNILKSIFFSEKRGFGETQQCVVCKGVAVINSGGLDMGWIWPTVWREICDVIEL